jgi:hypothetical protein
MRNVTWLSALLLLAVAPAMAATPAEKCVGAKRQAFGKAVDGRAQCFADARKKGTAVDAVCLAKVTAKLRDQFEKAEKHATCPGDADERLAAAISCTTSFDGATTGDASCAAAKIKAAGKKAAGKKTCEKKNLLKGADLATCLAKVEVKFAKTIAKAESKRTCTGTADAIESLVDGCIAESQAAIPCTGGSGSPVCDGSCPDGLTCRPYEVFTNGESTDAGCSCVDVVNGPPCEGASCGTDRHCEDPMHVCERWVTDDGCDHMVCQPAMTTPTTLPPPGDPIECTGGEYPTCGGACPNGMRCQSFVAFFSEVPFFAGCACVEPSGPRCELTEANCNLQLAPRTHCADPSKTCVVQIAGEGDQPTCSEAICTDPPHVVVTTTTSLPGTTSSSTSTSVTTTTSTSSTIPCVSAPATSGHYQDLGDCTILDTNPGLQWEKKSDDIPGGLHDVSRKYPWSGCCDRDCSTAENHCQPDAAASATCFALAQGAVGCGMCETGTCVLDFFDTGNQTTVWGFINQVNADNFAGHDDWRLAKENGFNSGELELESILLMPFPCTTDPNACIDPIFGPTAPDLYWSATTKGPTGPNRPTDGWFVDFLHGNFGDSGKWAPQHVRAVRDAD